MTAGKALALDVETLRPTFEVERKFLDQLERVSSRKRVDLFMESACRLASTPERRPASGWDG